MAMTPAEKQAAYRARQKQPVGMQDSAQTVFEPPVFGATPVPIATSGQPEAIRRAGPTEEEYVAEMMALPSLGDRDTQERYARFRWHGFHEGLIASL